MQKNKSFADMELEDIGENNIDKLVKIVYFYIITKKEHAMTKSKNKHLRNKNFLIFKATFTTKRWGRWGRLGSFILFCIFSLLAIDIMGYEMQYIILLYFLSAYRGEKGYKKEKVVQHPHLPHLYNLKRDVRKINYNFKSEQKMIVNDKPTRRAQQAMTFPCTPEGTILIHCLTTKSLSV